MIELEADSCPLCGALVLRKDELLKSHEEWHLRQTKILERMTSAIARLSVLVSR